SPRAVPGPKSPSCHLTPTSYTWRMPSASASTSAVVRPLTPSSGRTSCIPITSGASARSWPVASSRRRSSGGRMPQKLIVTTRRVAGTVPPSAAAHRAARVCGLGDLHLAERQAAGQLAPEVHREHLGGGVLEAGEVVEHA